MYSCSNATDAFYCLVFADTELLQSVNLALCEAYFYGAWTFVPVVDGDFIQERPLQAIAEGKLNSVCVITLSLSASELRIVDSKHCYLSLTRMKALSSPIAITLQT